MEKKYLFGMFAAATMLLATSCSSEEFETIKNGNEATVTFTAQLPEGLQTKSRAFGDGTTATTLSCYVYDENWNYIEKLSTMDANIDNLKADVSLTLVNGETYHVVFWADATSSPYTINAATGTVSMNYDAATANAENRDAFVQVVDMEVKGATSQVVPLKRPFAQINIGTTDWDAVENNTNVSITKTGIEVATYSTFNFNGQSVKKEDAINATFSLTNIPTENFPNTELGVDKYLSMNYILVGEDKSLVDVTINYDGGVQSRTFAQVPVQRNYCTNIYGALITSDHGFNTQITPQFADEHLYEPFTDLASGGTATANCYIVSEAGKYTFPATYKGNETTASIDASSIDDAVVLWESFGTATAPNEKELISEISYNEENGNITFKATDKKGNAVIAAKAEDGTILWSWHIWLTDAPQDQVYRNNAGTMLDRNLGATSATPGDVGALGLLYQWGRKDPFLGSSSTTESIQALSTITWPNYVESSNKGTETTPIITIEYAVANPTTFIAYGTNRVQDWLSPGSDQSPTYEYFDTHFDTRWGLNKTIYDPCPAGYRVPEGSSSVESIWEKALGIGTFTDSNADYSADGVNKGIDFAKTSYKFVDGGTCWYPATGYLDQSDAKLECVGSIPPEPNTSVSTYYWTCMPRNPREMAAAAMRFTPKGEIILNNPYNSLNFRAYGMPVRCIKE